MTIAKPCLESIYALQFRRMQQTSCDKEHNAMDMVETNALDSWYSYHQILARTTDSMEANLVVVASDTGLESIAEVNNNDTGQILPTDEGAVIGFFFKRAGY